MSLPALADQAGEARNDIVGIFFLLAAVADRAQCLGRGERGGRRRWRATRRRSPRCRSARWSSSAWLPASPRGPSSTSCCPAAVLVVGLVAVAPRGRRLAALAAGGLAALAGGGYWYLRNLAHTGNPLPWFDGIGPISLPAPEQALGGREAHSVLGYLSDGTVWSEWLLPGLQHGLGSLWPLLVLAAAGRPRLALPC